MFDYCRWHWAYSKNIGTYSSWGSFINQLARSEFSCVIWNLSEPHVHCESPPLLSLKINFCTISSCKKQKKNDCHFHIYELAGKDSISWQQWKEMIASNFPTWRSRMPYENQKHWTRRQIYSWVNDIFIMFNVGGGLLKSSTSPCQMSSVWWLMARHVIDFHYQSSLNANKHRDVLLLS